MKKDKKSQLNDKLYILLENLFRELDQDALKLEVEALKERKPNASKQQLVDLLTRRAAVKSAFTGMTAGAPGGVLGVIAIAPDIFNLVRQQSRLVLSIAFVYEQEPNLDERIREVVATLAIATGAAASHRGVRYLISKGLSGNAFQSLLRKIAGKYAARKLPTAIGPIIGGAAGAAINYAAVKSISSLATDYYRQLSKEQATAEPPKLAGSSALPESRIVDTTATSRRTGSSEKSPVDERKKDDETKKSAAATTQKSSGRGKSSADGSSKRSGSKKKTASSKKKAASSKKKTSSSKKKASSSKKKSSASSKSKKSGAKSSKTTRKSGGSAKSAKKRSADSEKPDDQHEASD